MCPIPFYFPTLSRLLFCFWEEWLQAVGCSDKMTLNPLVSNSSENLPYNFFLLRDLECLPHVTVLDGCLLFLRSLMTEAVQSVIPSQLLRHPPHKKPSAVYTPQFFLDSLGSELIYFPIDFCKHITGQ